MRVWICLLVLTGFLAGAPSHAQPQRIVSLDYCADQYVLGLADRQQIAALSMDAAADYSSHAGVAAGLEQVRARAGEVLSQRPDLVVRSWGGDPGSLAFYDRMGIAVHQIGPVSTLDDIRRETRAAGAVFGQPLNADTALARMDEALARVSASLAISALYVTPGGVTAGQGTFIDALLEAAGLRNASADRAGWISLPLEAIATRSPDMFVTGFINSDTDRVDRWSASRHPVMRRALEARPVFALETGVIACPTWLAGEEAQRLNAFARRHIAISASRSQP